LWRRIESYGLDPRLLIKEFDFTPGEMRGLRARIPFDRYDRLRTDAAELTGDPLIGLRSADHVHPSHLGALGFAWMASSSLLTGIKRLVRYGRMVNEYEHWLIDEGPEELVLTVELASPVQRIDEVTDSLLAGMIALCRLNYGQHLNPNRVTMKRALPQDPGPWFGFFRCPVVFASDANRLALSMEMATKALSGSDPDLASMHEAVIQKYLCQLDRHDVLNRARVEIIDQLPSGKVSGMLVAQALNMTTRTLHRRLQKRGTTFQLLLTEVRRSLVMSYLENAELSLTEIAFLLGYADSSAFSRAFRRWFGMSPGAMRNEIERSGARL